MNHILYFLVVNLFFQLSIQDLVFNSADVWILESNDNINTTFFFNCLYKI